MKLIDILTIYNFRYFEIIDDKGIYDTKTIRIFPDFKNKPHQWFEIGIECFHEEDDEEVKSRFTEILTTDMLNRQVLLISNNQEFNILEIYLIK